jgi:protein transport protein SEC61 subunit gamma-like protein
MSDQARDLIEIPQRFVKEGTQVSIVSLEALPGCSRSRQFLNRCTKPDKKGNDTISQGSSAFTDAPERLALEYLAICRAVAIGFAVMGFIGYFVKLIHIPVRLSLLWSLHACSLSRHFRLTTSLCS